MNVTNDITADEAIYIRELQRYLRSIQQAVQGYSNVPVDGIYGRDTELAVRSFQQSVGLPVTGNVDRVTWEALFASYQTVEYLNANPYSIYGFRMGQPPLAVGTQNDAVYMLQIILQKLHSTYTYIPAVDTPTGIYTENTAAAVRMLQFHSGINKTGITDKATWDRIIALYNQE